MPSQSTELSRRSCGQAWHRRPEGKCDLGDFGCFWWPAWRQAHRPSLSGISRSSTCTSMRRGRAPMMLQRARRCSQKWTRRTSLSPCCSSTSLEMSPAGCKRRPDDLSADRQCPVHRLSRRPSIAVSLTPMAGPVLNGSTEVWPLGELASWEKCCSCIPATIRTARRCDSTGRWPRDTMCRYQFTSIEARHRGPGHAAIRDAVPASTVRWEIPPCYARCSNDTRTFESFSTTLVLRVR